MKYEEPKVDVRIPITLLRRIKDCLQTELETPYNTKSQAQRNKRKKVERAMMIVSDALIDYEVKDIIGDSLSDDSLKKLFPTRRKKRVQKKQHD